MSEFDPEKCTIGAKLTQAFKDQTGTLKIIKDGVERQNGRVRAIEKWMWALSGAIGILTIKGIFNFAVEVLRK